MDEKKVREAIETFQGQVDWLKRIDDKGCEEARRCCIEYFEIAIEALEKQLPKKVENRTEYRNLYGHLIFYKGFCPSCGRVVESYRNNSCHVCTQKLDWTET